MKCKGYMKSLQSLQPNSRVMLLFNEQTNSRLHISAKNMCNIVVPPSE